MLAKTTRTTALQKLSSVAERPGTISCSLASNASTQTARVKLRAVPTANRMKLTATKPTDSGLYIPHMTPLTKRTR